MKSLMVLSVMLGGSIMAVQSLINSDTTTTVIIKVPHDFQFTEVNLRLQNGEILAPSMLDTSVTCQVGSDTVCDQCCNGNGACSSVESGCLCSENFDPQYDCRTRSVFRIENFWTTGSRFVYHSSHALYRELVEATVLGVLLDDSLYVTFNESESGRRVDSIQSIGKIYDCYYYSVTYCLIVLSI